MRNPYTVDYFIAKFRRIPSSKFGTQMFHDPSTGTRCAIGHCGVDSWTKQPELTAEALALIRLFGPAKHRGEVLSRAAGFMRLITINNHKSPGAPQRTPRARILAALHSLKATPTRKETRT